MKIALISGHFPPMRSGVGDYTYHLSRALAELGESVAVLTSSLAGSEYRGVPEVQVRPLVKSWGWESVQSLRAELAALRPDIVHIQYPSWFQPDRTLAVHLLPRLLRRLPSAPKIVFTLHEVMRARWRWLARPLVSAALSDCLIEVVEHDQRRLQRLFPWKKVECIYIGANILPRRESWLMRSQTRAGLGLSDKDVLLFYFGAARLTTGIDQALQAYADLLPRLPFLKFLLVSDLNVQSRNDYVSPSDARRTSRQIDSLGLTDRVILRNYAEPELISQYIAASDIGIFSYTDGAARQRGALLACLAHGLPVITTASRLLPENYSHLENMFLVKAQDREALAAGMEQMALSTDLRAQISRGALELSKSFEWESIAQKTLRVYRAALA